MRIKVNAAIRLTEMELGESDHEFGFSVEDIAEAEHETSEGYSHHSLVWRDHDTGNFYEMEWAMAKSPVSDDFAIFDMEGDMVQCPQVVPEQGTMLVWRQV